MTEDLTAEVGEVSKIGDVVRNIMLMLKVMKEKKFPLRISRGG